jgi:hypothetical protein
MASSGMCRRVASIRTDVSEERFASSIKVCYHLFDGGDTFLRNVGSYKRQTM